MFLYIKTMHERQNFIDWKANNIQLTQNIARMLITYIKTNDNEKKNLGFQTVIQMAS